MSTDSRRNTEPVFDVLADSERRGEAELLKEHIERVTDRIAEERIGSRVDRSPIPPLWTVTDVAEYLNVSKRTVETLIAEGEISPIRIRNQRRFDRDAIKAYVRSQVE